MSSLPVQPSFLRGVVAVALLLGSATASSQATSRLQCRILENGQAGSGTVTVLRGTDEVASGSCGSPLPVPAGDYTVVLKLDGALDRPEQRRNVTLRAGQTETVSADFATATLEMRITANGQRAAGMAVIRRNGQQIGTLGGGVSAHLSAGTYEIVARYRTQERRFDAVTLAPGERRTISADF